METRAGEPGVRAATGAGSGPDADAAVAAALASVRAGLGGATVDLAVVFVGAAHAHGSETIAATVRAELAPRHLLGVTAGAIIVDAAEIDRADALALWALVAPGADLTPLRVPPPDPSDPAEADASPPKEPPVAWPAPPAGSRCLLLLADPFTFPGEAFLDWAATYAPGMPICGGLASATAAPGGNRLLLDDAVHRDGAVGMAIGGDVVVRTVVSQGCRPIGSAYVVTAAERNLIVSLGGAPPVERIQEAFQAAAPTDRDLMRTGLHVGIALDEYRDELGRGDFLIRGVMGVQPDSGAVAVGSLVDVGQTIQFQVRDAVTADEDLRTLLDHLTDSEDEPAAALLFSCNGRGHRLFGVDDHDAGLVADALNGAPTAGFFAAGEFGPVGARSYLHGFTASVIVFDR